MKEATFDPAKKLKLYFRCNRTGSKVFVFVYSDETPYSLIYEDVELNIYRNAGDKKKLIELSVSFNSNRVTTSITSTQSNVNEGEYYWELYRPDLGKTWLTGPAIFHNGEFDGVESDTETITVSENGEEVLITVSDTNYSYVTRTLSTTSTATLTPNINNYDLFAITAQAEALTIANPIGTPSEGNGYVIKVKGTGAFAITFGDKFSDNYGNGFPATTLTNKWLYIIIARNEVDDTYDVLNYIEEV